MLFGVNLKNLLKTDLPALKAGVMSLHFDYVRTSFSYVSDLNFKLAKFIYETLGKKTLFVVDSEKHLEALSRLYRDSPFFIMGIEGPHISSSDDVSKIQKALDLQKKIIDAFGDTYTIIAPSCAGIELGYVKNGLFAGLCDFGNLFVDEMLVDLDILMDAAKRASNTKYIFVSSFGNSEIDDSRHLMISYGVRKFAGRAVACSYFDIKDLIDVESAYLTECGTKFNLAYKNAHEEM